MTPVALLRSLLSDSWSRQLAGSSPAAVLAHTQAAELLSDDGPLESADRIRVAHDEWKARCLALTHAVTRIVAGQPVDFDALGRENTTATVVAVRMLSERTARTPEASATFRGRLALYASDGTARLGGDSDAEPWVGTVFDASDGGKAALKALEPMNGRLVEFVIRPMPSITTETSDVQDSES